MAKTTGVCILGVHIVNASQDAAVSQIELWLRNRARARSIFIANAHTLNLSASSADYRQTLNSADRVYADGTGVRWAARLRGVRIKDNLVGTDLVPRVFKDLGGHGFRYFLLGARPQSIAAAAAYCTEHFPGWTLAGYSDGYVAGERTNEVIRQINESGAHLLLVGMGNPLQEQWIARHCDALQVPVCIGVGGLFDHWSGNLKRAPEWVRRQGFEWLQILVQQPHKWRRYLLGNPLFLARIALALPTDLLAARAAARRAP